MVRRIASANEMFDILSNMDSGKFASFCHLNYAPIDSPKKGKNIDFDTIGKKFNINDLKGIITITRYYDLNWSNQQSIAQKYASFRQSANEIRRKFGLEDAQKRKSPFQTVKHGLGIVLGNTPNIKDRTYFSQNTFNCKRDISYYGVNSVGRIICEFLPQHLKEYLKDRKRDIDGYNKLCKITQDEKVLGDYINQIMNLKMEYTRFMCDRIIYIIGADREGKFIFANNNLTSEINGLKIDKNQLLGIVQQKYKLDLNKINENTMKRQIVRLTEQDLHKVINESVRRIIKERILGQGESFTPYTEKDREENFSSFHGGDKRTPEERNPSYAKALRDAEERRRQKKTSMEEEINEIGDTNRGQYMLGATAAR